MPKATSFLRSLLLLSTCLIVAAPVPRSIAATAPPAPTMDVFLKWRTVYRGEDPGTYEYSPWSNSSGYPTSDYLQFRFGDSNARFWVSLVARARVGESYFAGGQNSEFLALQEISPPDVLGDAHDDAEDEDIPLAISASEAQEMFCRVAEDDRMPFMPLLDGQSGRKFDLLYLHFDPVALYQWSEVDVPGFSQSEYTINIEALLEQALLNQLGSQTLFEAFLDYGKEPAINNGLVLDVQLLVVSDPGDLSPYTSDGGPEPGTNMPGGGITGLGVASASPVLTFSFAGMFPKRDDWLTYVPNGTAPTPHTHGEPLFFSVMARCGTTQVRLSPDGQMPVWLDLIPAPGVLAGYVELPHSWNVGTEFTFDGLRNCVGTNLFGPDMKETFVLVP